MEKYLDFTVQEFLNLCRIPSPTGFTGKVEGYVLNVLSGFGFTPQHTRKRSILVDLGGEGSGLVLTAHVDTLGAMVRSIKPNGRIRFSKIGGYPENFIEGENCIIHTRLGPEYTGTIQFENTPVHLIPANVINETIRNDTNMSIVIDEKVKSKEDVKELGINTGDFISFDPRTICTEKGFIKSRFIDDKAGCAILLALAKYIREQNIKLNRKVYLLFTNCEEVGHGGSSGIPEGAEEIIAVDTGIIGDDMETDEYKVAIDVKDAGGPYNYEVTGKLIEIAKEYGINFSLDMCLNGKTDSSQSLFSGYDLKHGFTGPGTSALHGYERTHREGIMNTLSLLKGYISR